MIDLLSCTTGMGDLACQVWPPIQNDSEKDWIDYINMFAVLVATASAGVSAVCASQANKNVYSQERNNRYDTLYGNALHAALEEAYQRIDIIKRALLSQTLLSSTVAEIVENADNISASQLSRQCARIDHDFSLNDRMSNLYEELDNALSSVKSFVTGTATDKVVRANNFIVSAEEFARKIEQENLVQRENFSKTKRRLFSK